MRGICVSQGATKAISGVYIGGQCVRSRGGSPAWAVALWVLFSLVAGAAAGIGLLWWNERRLRLSTGQNDSLYHELSMDTGF